MSGHLVDAEWRRGRESLRAGQLCLHNGLYADAISRSYYSVLHAAKAVLHVHNISAESHAGVRSMFGLHIVMANLVEPKWGGEIGDMADLRFDADYDVTLEFDETDGREACERASAFLDRVRPLLAHKS